MVFKSVPDPSVSTLQPAEWLPIVLHACPQWDGRQWCFLKALSVEKCCPLERIPGYVITILGICVTCKILSTWSVFGQKNLPKPISKQTQGVQIGHASYHSIILRTYLMSFSFRLGWISIYQSINLFYYRSNCHHHPIFGVPGHIDRKGKGSGRTRGFFVQRRSQFLFALWAHRRRRLERWHLRHVFLGVS